MCWLYTQMTPRSRVIIGEAIRPALWNASPMAYIPEPTFPFNRCTSVSKNLRVGPRSKDSHYYRTESCVWQFVYNWVYKTQINHGDRNTCAALKETTSISRPGSDTGSNCLRVRCFCFRYPCLLCLNPLHYKYRLKWHIKTARAEEF
jgi:hypothetical protein